MNKVTRYEVLVRVYGNVVVGVEATSFKQAERLANEEVGEMDFGELSDIEWEACRIERDSDGKVVLV